MILSGLEISERLGSDVIIKPFDQNRLNPNSYNLSLHNELICYDNPILDMKDKNTTHKFIIPEEGLVLEPHKLYLGRTVEYTETFNLVPMLEGRSSVGRLGLFVHVTAGFGDVGFKGYWTLEIFAVQPIKIYPGVQICQIFYHSIQGNYVDYTNGKYQNNEGIQASLLFQDFNENTKKSAPIAQMDRAVPS